MKIAIWPFYSQQDKSTGKFLLNTCGAAKQLSWLARKFTAEGWGVRVAVPWHTDEVTPFPPECARVKADMFPCNAIEQVRWDVRELDNVFRGCDVALLNHELLAIPVRRLFPKLKIVQMCSVRPDSAMFKVAWDSADLVVAQSQTARMAFRPFTATPISVWPLAFNEQDTFAPYKNRDVDVLFVQRCSVTNYTHHEEFLQAMELMHGLRVAFTDVTEYLRKTHPHLEYSTPETYKQYLARSKVAVALNDNLYGGLSIREACRAGCTPVVLDAPCYHELVGERYRHFVRELKPENIADAVHTALDEPRAVDVSSESYQASWPVVKRDLLCLSR